MLVASAARRRSSPKALRFASAGDVGAPSGTCGVASRRPRRRNARPLIARDDVRADGRQRVRDALRVAGSAEDAVDPAGGDGGEEVLEVESQHDALADVAARVREHRVAAAKALRLRMWRNDVEDLVEDAPLHVLEEPLRALEHA